MAWAAEMSQHDTQSDSSGSSGPSGQSSPQEHLVVLFHGLGGAKEDLAYLQGLLERDSTTLVHAVTANEGRTTDGILAGAQRAVEEISVVISEHGGGGLTYISVVGNSLGGLYAREFVHLMHDPTQATVAGLTPKWFMTIATPHLGIRFFTYVQVPQFLGKVSTCTVFRPTTNDGTPMPRHPARCCVRNCARRMCHRFSLPPSLGVLAQNST